MKFHSAYGFVQEDVRIHQKLADYFETVQIDEILHQTTTHTTLLFAGYSIFLGLMYLVKDEKQTILRV